MLFLSILITVKRVECVVCDFDTVGGVCVYGITVAISRHAAFVTSMLLANTS